MKSLTPVFRLLYHVSNLVPRVFPLKVGRAPPTSKGNALGTRLLPQFDVICDQLLNRHTAACNLFVKYASCINIIYIDAIIITCKL